MQASATPRKPASKPYQKVFDSRKRRVRGLWQRGGRFYANLTVADDMGRRASRWVPLGASTLVEAQADLRKLVVEREDDRLRPLGLTPTFAEYVDLPALDVWVQSKQRAPRLPPPTASLNPTGSSYAAQLLSSGKRATSLYKERSYLWPH